MTKEEARKRLLDWIQYATDPERVPFLDEPCSDEEIILAMRIGADALSLPSLPSNMDEAAEKAALKAYPEKDALNKKATGHYDPNYPRRKAYQQGYEQAEKDLATLALGKLELS